MYTQYNTKKLKINQIFRISYEVNAKVALHITGSVSSVELVKFTPERDFGKIYLNSISKFGCIALFNIINLASDV